VKYILPPSSKKKDKYTKKSMHFSGHILQLLEGNEMDKKETWCYDETPVGVL
jgi:hypothetical protein